jgi:hypothetical protein
VERSERALANLAGIKKSSDGKPNDQRQDGGDNHAGHDRKVEKAVLCFDANVTRQVSETEPQSQGHSNDQKENGTDGDQYPLHSTQSSRYLPGATSPKAVLGHAFRTISPPGTSIGP